MMDRISRLSTNQSTTAFFTCSVCTATSAVSADDICDFCWYDFEATEDERRIVNESSVFRELSVHQWYAKLHVTKIPLSWLSPVTVMHILHDCFRVFLFKPAVERCLQTATNVFPDGVLWLRRLMRGSLPIILQSTVTDRIYKFSAGSNRTPVWYKITKDESDSKLKWSWTPYNPMTDNENTGWLPCPQLLVSEGSFTGQVPVAESIFIIMFLHTFRPDPPSEEMVNKRNSNLRIKNRVREDVLKNFSNLTVKANKS
ncbi:unnamed protein product [Adineta steineri]|uniref:Uncharacterized protein n=1 Tax=Adineta steineri TaxID=433720 RepID=A0A814WL59_9BILA|nr:unnamed protein product [Adineta steineri]CAF1203842.1 unnamed protein product [Adineta steineri]CAF1287800.1 unnamed protein product [Adineta steineri]